MNSYLHVFLRLYGDKNMWEILFFLTYWAWCINFIAMLWFSNVKSIRVYNCFNGTILVPNKSVSIILSSIYPSTQTKWKHCGFFKAKTNKRTLNWFYEILLFQIKNTKSNSTNSKADINNEYKTTRSYTTKIYIKKFTIVKRYFKLVYDFYLFLKLLSWF